MNTLIRSTFLAGAVAALALLNAPVLGQGLGPLFDLRKPGTREAFDVFGNAVAMSGSRLVVGVYDDSTEARSAGRAYVYDLDGATPATPVLTLVHPNAAADEFFGSAVAVSGSIVVVGVPYSNVGALDSGRVYVFDVAGATPSVPVHVLDNPSPNINDQFGFSVSVSGTRVVVGAPFGDTPPTGSGAAYVYDIAGATPTQPVRTLSYPTTGFLGTFGWSVGISGDTVAVGSLYTVNGVQIYDLAGGTPETPVRQLVQPFANNDSAFGSAVAVSGSRVVVGAPGLSLGRAYVFDLASATPETPVADLDFGRNGAETQNTDFGASVAIDGTKVVVGAPKFDRGGADAGRAFLYDLDLPTFSSELAPATVEAGGQTGFSVAISGTRAAVSTAFRDGDSTDEGEVTVFGPDTVQPVITSAGGSLALFSRTLLPDYRALAVVNDASPIASIQQFPANGTPLLPGTFELVLVAFDVAGNRGEATFTITVTPGPVTATTVAFQGSAVPNAGGDERIQAGAKFTKLGSPAIGAGGHVAYSAMWAAPAGNGLPAQRGTGIFVNDTLVVAVGEFIPGVGVWKSFLEPVVDADGNVSFIGRIAGSGITGATDDVVASNDVGGMFRTAKIVAREGAPAAGATNWKRFTSVVPTGDGLAFTGTMKAPAAVDGGIWARRSADTAPELVIREGNAVQAVADGDVPPLPDEKFLSIAALPSASGSAGQGSDFVGGFAVFANVTTTKGRKGIGLADSGGVMLAATGEPVNAPANQFMPIDRAIWKAFGPVRGSTDATGGALFYTFLGTVANNASGDSGVTKANATAVFRKSGVAFEALARISESAPVVPGAPAAVFKTLKDPVIAPGSAAVAFQATIAGQGVSGAVNDCIWWTPGNAAVRLAAREGDQPPGAPQGAKWQKFETLAISGGNTGPLFIATLKPGSGGVNSRNDRALYGTGSDGAVVELLRENQTLLGKTVKGFETLKAARGATGVSRSFNNAAQAVALVTFSDNTTAIVKIAIP